MRMLLRIFYIIIFLVMSFVLSYSQSYDFTAECDEYLQLPFVSDGYDYSIEIKKEEKGEFKTTFYGGSTYRIVACSNLPQGRIIYTIFDTEKNKLFSSDEYNYPNYWDFYFKSTIDCIIEVKFESEMVEKAQIELLIGFKNQ